MYKKLVSFILSVYIIFSCGVLHMNGSAEVYEQKDKIAVALQEEMCRANSSDTIPVYIWLNDIDHETIEYQTAQRTGYSKESLISESVAIIRSVVENNISEFDNSNIRYNDISGFNFKDMSEIAEYLEVTNSKQEILAHKTDKYITAQRELSRNAYLKKSNRFIQDNLANKKIMFQSQYAPMIICELTKDEISRICLDRRVAQMSLYVDYDATDLGNFDASLSAICADVTKNQGVKGRYVKIGQIESGTPNVNVNALAGKNVIKRCSTPNNEEHATLVASIIVGDDGVAPSATLYSTSALYDVSSNSIISKFSTNKLAVEYENIEWLISQGVNVINRSYSPEVTLGKYTEYSKLIDHISDQHGVTFVQAAGNGGCLDHPNCGYDNCETVVSLLSYNAIVVGGINDMGTSSVNDDTYFFETSLGPNKPDVVAPAVGFYTEGAFSSPSNGTSFAAPLVTGVVAQMMCSIVALKLRPDAIKAALMASCDRKTIPNASINELTKQEGAGVINARNAINSLSRVLVQETYYTTTSKTLTYNFYPQSTGRKVIVVSWMVPGTGTETSPDMADYDTEIYDSVGNLVCSSAIKGNNVEYIGFNATTTGKYTVKVIRKDSGTSSQRITIANYNE